MASLASGLLGARAVHLHVHMDGEVWRRLWRANGYSRGRRCPRQHAARRIAQAGDPIRHSFRRILHPRDSAVLRPLPPPDLRDGPGIALLGSANVVRFFGVSAWLGPDEFPFPSGGVVVLLD